MGQQQYTINDFKSTVNSFLCRLNGSKTHRQDPTKAQQCRHTIQFSMVLEFSDTIYGIAKLLAPYWSHKLEKG